MNYEQLWVENDAKVELLAEKMKELRREYRKKHPEATDIQVENYVNNALRQEAKDIVWEQFRIASSSLTR